MRVLIVGMEVGGRDLNSIRTASAFFRAECFVGSSDTINYASENLDKAVLYSMRSTESLQERLAGCHSIFHVLSQPGHLPPELKKRFDVMIKAMTMMPDDTGKGTVYATTSKMDELEASKWLEEILSLFMEVEKTYEAEGPHKSF